MPFRIRQTPDTNDPAWLALRCAFIPEATLEEHAHYLARFAAGSFAFSSFVAEDDVDGAVGFAEVSVRTDHVNGCSHRPALFLEGIYVHPEHRNRGIARALCASAEAWGAIRGCREFASDVLIDDDNSLAAHEALGFRPAETVVCFHKTIDVATSSSATDPAPNGNPV